MAPATVSIDDGDGVLDGLWVFVVPSVCEALAAPGVLDASRVPESPRGFVNCDVVATGEAGITPPPVYMRRPIVRPITTRTPPNSAVPRHFFWFMMFSTSRHAQHFAVNEAPGNVECAQRRLGLNGHAFRAADEDFALTHVWYCSLQSC
jgi:hypothetical protein